tara:strand:+ start:298 stop:1872 length:1575 start_codon:yes stop_codon:yes gene_type:complete
MSRTFKRPMFRKGGNVGVGIMSGITDRVQAASGYPNPEEEYLKRFDPQKFAERENILTDQLTALVPDIKEQAKGIELEGYESPEAFKSAMKIEEPRSISEYIAQLREGVGGYQGTDPLTTFLLSAGPQIATATSLSDAVSKLGPANKALLDRLGKEAEFERSLRLKGTELGFADQARADDQRYKLALTADERDYKNFLTQDERNYLRASTLDNRAYNDLTEDKKQAFQINLLKQTRAYENLDRDRKEALDAKLLREQRAYEKMTEQEKRAYEKRLINNDQAFQLTKITETVKAQTAAAGGSADFVTIKEQVYNDTQDISAANQMGEILTTEYKYVDGAGNDRTGTLYDQAKGFLASELAPATNYISTDLNIKSNLKNFTSANKKNFSEGIKYFVNAKTGGITEVRKPVTEAEKETAKKQGGYIVKNYSFSDIPEIKEIDPNLNEEEEIVTETRLTRSDAERIAGERGLTLIPERPKGDKSKTYINQQKQKLGPNAITVKELEDLIKKEEFSEKYKNIKGPFTKK